jgi:hypothetical protein
VNSNENIQLLKLLFDTGNGGFYSRQKHTNKMEQRYKNNAKNSTKH